MLISAAASQLALARSLGCAGPSVYHLNQAETLRARGGHSQGGQNSLELISSRDKLAARL